MPNDADGPRPEVPRGRRRDPTPGKARWADRKAGPPVRILERVSRTNRSCSRSMRRFRPFFSACLERARYAFKPVTGQFASDHWLSKRVAAVGNSRRHEGAGCPPGCGYRPGGTQVLRRPTCSGLHDWRLRGLGAAACRVASGPVRCRCQVAPGLPSVASVLAMAARAGRAVFWAFQWRPARL